jgi:hypothetical protein
MVKLELRSKFEFGNHAMKGKRSCKEKNWEEGGSYWKADLGNTEVCSEIFPPSNIRE